MKTSKRNEQLLLLMWTISLVATSGSLFYSEVVGFTPCELCWIQRIFMYPLVIIYGVALWKRNISIALPGMFLCGIGMLISLYHYLLQKVPALSDAGNSCGMIPCNTQYVNYFGFITIPFMAGIAFMLIFIIQCILLNQRGE